jgi:hypothetical protein
MVAITPTWLQFSFDIRSERCVAKFPLLLASAVLSSTIQFNENTPALCPAK